MIGSGDQVRNGEAKLPPVRGKISRVSTFDAALEVRAQRLGSGHRINLVLFRLPRIAKHQRLTLPVGAARSCRGQRLARAHADHMSLVLGGAAPTTTDFHDVNVEGKSGYIRDLRS
jgi:hypothetical protein